MKEIILQKSNFRCRENIYICRPLRRLWRLAVEYVKKSFKNEKYKKDTQLSKYIWNLKKSNIQYKINWEILQKSNTHMRRSQICNICLEENIKSLKTMIPSTVEMNL